jgi:hypothetical protein
MNEIDTNIQTDTEERLETASIPIRALTMTSYKQETNRLVPLHDSRKMDGNLQIPTDKWKEVLFYYFGIRRDSPRAHLVLSFVYAVFAFVCSRYIFRLGFKMSLLMCLLYFAILVFWNVLPKIRVR